MEKFWIKRLYCDFEQLSFAFNLSLPKPLITVANLSGKWGTFDPLTRTIVIAKELILHHDWPAVLEVLKHETAHYLVQQSHGDELCHGHGHAFKDACRRLGTSAWASASDEDLASIPHPGTAAPDSEDERMMRRVEKLLALATSSNEHEAFLAMERVRDLYLRYNMERLAARTTEDFTYCVINTKRQRVSREVQIVFSILSAHYFVEVIQVSTFDPHTCRDLQAYEILGTSRNVKLAEYVYHFLINTLPRLWQAYQSQTAKSQRLRRSYMIGVLRGFDEKLRKETEWSKDQQSTQPGLVVAAQDTRRCLQQFHRELHRFVKTRHPKIIRKGAGSTTLDRDTYAAGVKEGGRLTISHGIASNSGAARYLLS